MKKIFATLMVVVMIFSLSAGVNATGLEYSSSATEKYLGNGLYCVITYGVEDEISTYASNTKTGYKIYRIKNDGGNEVAMFKITATFTYTGSSSTCKAATYETEVYKNGWNFTNTSANYTGNTATGSFTIIHKVLGITINTINDSITLSCDKNGNIS